MTVRSVTVVLPVHNGEDYIESAIASLLQQPELLELVISDDCSTDRTIELIQRFGDDRIRLVRNTQKGGQFVNFNRAISCARGEFIQFFSHDDIADPGFLSSQQAAFFDRLDIGLVYSSCALINEAGVQFDVRDDEGTPVIIDHPTYLEISALHGALPLSVSCIMVRRAHLDRAGGFDPSYRVAGDLEFVNRIAAYGPIARNRTVNLKIRIHQASVTRGKDTPLAFMEEEARLLSYYREHLGEEGFQRMLRSRVRTRGSDHGKYILRSVLTGRFAKAQAAARELGKAHNVGACVWTAMLQKAGIARRPI
jgi:glycosyltransferase involved in cell wall biosynthesis